GSNGALQSTGLAWLALVTGLGVPLSLWAPKAIEHGHVEHLVRYRCDPYYQLRSPGGGEAHCFKSMPVLTFGDQLTLSPCPTVCGKPKNPASQVQRIIGGFMAARGSFPWQGRLLTRHNRTVGATLISDQWLLTTGRNLYLNHSAEATPEEIAPTLTLYLGDGQQPAGAIDRIVLHPAFPKDVDLALLRLQNKVTVGEAVMPICLPTKDYAQRGRVGYVSGWGRNVFLAHPDRLRYVMLPVAGQENCTDYYAARGPHGAQPLLGKHTFCVGMSELREDTCYGDAGGAFAVHDPKDDTWYAAGILSFDKTCTTGKYGVYVHVLSVFDWIKETLGAAP
uniref:Peptidase S1 domain-containing protein n=1 Tax=Sphenodon punctatus TaxID=8508 RepID=A0A8D0GJX7_SPHPU